MLLFQPNTTPADVTYSVHPPLWLKMYKSLRITAGPSGDEKPTETLVPLGECFTALDQILFMIIY